MLRTDPFMARMGGFWVQLMPSLHLLRSGQKLDDASALVPGIFVDGLEFYAELPRLFLRPKSSEKLDRDVAIRFLGGPGNHRTPVISCRVRDFESYRQVCSAVLPMLAHSERAPCPLARNVRHKVHQ